MITTLRLPLQALLLATALAALGLAPAAAVEIEFVFDPDDKSTEVKFSSKATLETFHGKSSRLVGQIRLDPADIRGLKAELRFDLASLDTGIGLRNDHMRKNVLHVDEYPEARLEIFGASVEESTALSAGGSIDAVLDGEMSLHGVARAVQIPVHASLSGDGQSLSIEAEFKIALADYEIERPKMLLLKVAEEVGLSVKATARRRPPAPEGESAVDGSDEGR